MAGIPIPGSLEGVPAVGETATGAPPPADGSVASGDAGTGDATAPLGESLEQLAAPTVTNSRKNATAQN
jgi:hypothetical protein